MARAGSSTAKIKTALNKVNQYCERIFIAFFFSPGYFIAPQNSKIGLSIRRILVVSAQEAT